MGNYDDIARKLTDDHKVKEAAHSDKVKADKDERDLRWAAERSLLEADALPLMEDAAIACRSHGLRPDVRNNWQTPFIFTPQIVFRLFGPEKRLLENAIYEVEANYVTVCVEDGKMKATVGSHFHFTIGKGYVGYGAEGVQQALEYSMATFSDEIDPTKN